MPAVDSNGITIEYDEQGAGEPLLLVMGLGGQLIDWPPALVDMLVDHGYRVISFDNRDVGLSSKTERVPVSVAQLARASLLRRQVASAYDLSDMAADAVGLLDALSIDSAHVVGMSMGGMIAQVIAIEHPARVRSLTSIMSTTGSRRVGRPKPRVVLGVTRRDKPTLETAAELVTDSLQVVSGPTFDRAECLANAQAAVDRSFNPEGTAHQLAAIMATPERTEALRSITAPTLVIHGMVDPLVQPSGGLATARAVPGARLLMFPDMGHDLAPTRLVEIADAIAANAARADGQRPSATSASTNS